MQKWHVNALNIECVGVFGEFAVTTLNGKYSTLEYPCAISNMKHEYDYLTTRVLHLTLAVCTAASSHLQNYVDEKYFSHAFLENIISAELFKTKDFYFTATAAGAAGLHL